MMDEEVEAIREAIAWAEAEYEKDHDPSWGWEAVEKIRAILDARP